MVAKQGSYEFICFRSQVNRKKCTISELMETPEGMIPLDIDDIGEMQLAAIDPFGLIVFRRPTGIGSVQIDLAELRKGYATELLIAHAKRLDKELKRIACEQP